jgi:hypothetical protein
MPEKFARQPGEALGLAGCCSHCDTGEGRGKQSPCRYAPGWGLPRLRLAMTHEPANRRPIPTFPRLPWGNPAVARHYDRFRRVRAARQVKCGTLSK